MFQETEEITQPFVYLGPGHPTLYYPQRPYQERGGADFLFKASTVVNPDLNTIGYPKKKQYFTEMVAKVKPICLRPYCVQIQSFFAR